MNFDKMQMRTIFTMNKLREIERLCHKHPITFRFTAGNDNPADCVSRPLGYKAVLRTSYYSGPSFIKDVFPSCNNEEFSVTLPNQLTRTIDFDESESDYSATDNVNSNDACVKVCSSSKSNDNISHIVPIDKFSSFTRLVNVVRLVYLYVAKIKNRIAVKNGKLVKPCSVENFFAVAQNRIIQTEQRLSFAEVFNYIHSKTKTLRDLPPIMSRLNVFESDDGLLRVKGKFPEGRENNPILLPKDSFLTKLIINSVHVKLAHSGVYCVIRELRRNYFFLHHFSVVRKVLRQCSICRRLNDRPVKLNQSAYRDFRVDPDSQPFSSVFIDYMGPWTVVNAKTKMKVYVLVITCLWSRAVNLKVCLSADVNEFLKALQLHVFDYGIFKTCTSDLGSQISAGFNILRTFLDDFDTQKYFEECGISKLSLTQFCKGNSALGSLVECCVKSTKRLIYKSIRNSTLELSEFQFLIAKVVHLVNRRPIAFKESLRDETENCSEITPELLIHGYHLPSVNVIPQLQCSEADNDPDFNPANTDFKDSYYKLKRVRERLIDIYHSEFIGTLIDQATNRKELYKPVSHKNLSVGDVVLLVEKFTKRSSYPLGRVLRVETNSLGETTSAFVKKGATGEKVYRHASSLIILIPCEQVESISSHADNPNNVPLNKAGERKSRRAAAISARESNRALYRQGVV